MAYEIILAPSAVKELDALRADIKGRVRDAIELHLRHEPTKVSKSRIKRLRGLDRPQYRLRVDEVRVFYDVAQETVQVLAIVSKAQADAWLKAQGTPSKTGGPRQSEG
jgi:mRNA-degrading endonuclease RelE of RelBE toxin-antitoxin system